ncbi:MAG: hypothetical protein H7X95_14125 [Deltaproteobacteria bacterium]|nr:hypothetical protein [Deltaproteobacteria bacterium]
MPNALSKRLPFVVTSLSIMGVLLLGGALLAEAKRAGKAPDAGVATTVATCKKDAECVLVPDDCCTCAESGKQHAIPKVQQGAYENARRKRCAGTMCPQMMSQDPSCSQRAVCNAGTCELGAVAH